MASHPVPGFITGTSTEYLGSRPLRRILRERPVVVVMGPPRSGKSTVGLRIAEHPDQRPHRIDTAQLRELLVRRARTGRWPREVTEARALVLDGPENLTHRPGPLQLLVDLLQARVEIGRRTVICDVRADGTVEALMEHLPSGSTAVLGLRFPNGLPGRLRFARRVCDQFGLPRSAARGTEVIEPWGYGEVVEALRLKKTG